MSTFNPSKESQDINQYNEGDLITLKDEPSRIYMVNPYKKALGGGKDLYRVLSSGLVVSLVFEGTRKQRRAFMKEFNKASLKN